MKHAIAGVSPSELGEVTNMVHWPSIARFALGRFHGRLYAIRLGFGHIFTLGKLFVLLTIPGALGLYFVRVAPFFAVRYRLTNRRMIIERGMKYTEVQSVSLDGFDEIEIQVLSGHAWYWAGDLVFKRSGTETFRLAAVVRPETFRQTCLKARNSFVGVQQILEREAARN